MELIRDICINLKKMHIVERTRHLPLLPSYPDLLYDIRNGDNIISGDIILQNPVRNKGISDGTCV
jgi:hypothetical protein